MNALVISDIGNIHSLLPSLNELFQTFKCQYISQVTPATLLWWDHFSSSDGQDFGSRRGRNFLGSRSWLNGIKFIIVKQDENIVGFAPLFLSEVILKGSREKVKILSTCPDSTLFFYQDMVISSVDKEVIIKKIFEKIELLIQQEDLIFIMGHVPENSINLPIYQREIGILQKKGYDGGVSVNSWRGGIFPWNLSKYRKILQQLYNETSKTDTQLAAQITLLDSELENQTSALMLFPGTRKVLEEKVRAIADKCSQKAELTIFTQDLYEIFITRPIRYPILYLPEDSETFFALLSASKRYFYKRYLKKFLNDGGSFESVRADKLEEKDIEDYLSLHRQRWQEESAAVTDQTIKFHQELSRLLSKSGYFHLFFAKYQGKRIAVLSYFDLNGRREFYYSGRDSTFENTRAGKLLVLHSLLDAIDKKIGIYDFGYGGDEYKFDFTDKYLTLKSIYLAKKGNLPDLDQIFLMYEQLTNDRAAV